MVYLNRIYTKTGDDGQTGLGNGDRVPKTHPRIAAYGSVDELNAVLGTVLTHAVTDEIAGGLRKIQNDLFDVGADLCVPEEVEDEEPHDHDHDEPAGETRIEPLRIIESQVTQLEHWIDLAVEKLTPLTSFILPGGTPAAAALHMARTVCRRAEIEVLQLAEFEPINPQVIVYLNRLSDLLFVWARLANDGGKADILWTPGSNR